MQDIEGITVELVTEYIYLGQNITLDVATQIHDINKRIQVA